MNLGHLLFVRGADRHTPLCRPKSIENVIAAPLRGWISQNGCQTSYNRSFNTGFEKLLIIPVRVDVIFSYEKTIAYEGPISHTITRNPGTFLTSAALKRNVDAVAAIVSATNFSSGCHATL